jgi:hypothetical protein
MDGTRSKTRENEAKMEGVRRPFYPTRQQTMSIKRNWPGSQCHIPSTIARGIRA